MDSISDSIIIFCEAIFIKLRLKNSIKQLKVCVIDTFKYFKCFTSFLFYELQLFCSISIYISLKCVEKTDLTKILIGNISNVNY